MLKLSCSAFGQISINNSCTSAPGDMNVNIHNGEQMAKKPDGTPNAFQQENE